MIDLTILLIFLSLAIVQVDTVLMQLKQELSK